MAYRERTLCLQEGEDVICLAQGTAARAQKKGPARGRGPAQAEMVAVRGDWVADWSAQVSTMVPGGPAPASPTSGQVLERC